MTRAVVVGRDVAHRPGDARDWRLCLPSGERLEAPEGERSLTASVLWAAWRQGFDTVAVRDADGGWRRTTPARLMAARLRRRLAASIPGAADRAWARLLALDLPHTGRSAGRADGPVVMVLPSLAGNGAERQALALMRGLTARGWPVHVLVKHLRDRPSAAELLPQVTALGLPVQVWSTPAPAPRLVPTPAVAVLETATDGLPDALAADLLALAGWITALKPRAVHGWLDATAILAAAAATLLGVPCAVAGLRNLAPDRMSHPLAKTLRPGLRRLAAHPAVTVTANSHAVAEDHMRWARIAAPTVLPNGVGALPEGPPQSARPPLVLGVFRLVAQKQPLLWLEVAARIHAHRPDTRFRLLGDGPLSDTVTARARALGLPLEQPGRVADPAPTLAEAAVLLHVSAAEGLPNAVLEALAAGVPVVATAAGGTAEALVTPPVVPPDPEALTARVVALLDDPQRRRVEAEAGRLSAQRYSLAALVARHERLYDLPPRRQYDDRRQAWAVRRRPRGLIRSLSSLVRLALAGQVGDITDRVATLRQGQTPRLSPPDPVPDTRSSDPAQPTARPPRPIRLVWVGETLDRDGAPLSLLDLVRGLGDHGIVTPGLGIALRDGPLHARWETAGWPIRVVPSPQPRTRRAQDRLCDTLVAPLAPSMAPADRVLVNGLRAFAGVEAAARAGRPCLWVIREPDQEALADLPRSLRARALAAFGWADRVAFVSHATAAAWADWCPSHKVAIIPNTLPPLPGSLPDRTTARAELGWPEDTIALLAVGTLCPRKDPGTLLAALPLLPDAFQARLRVAWVGRDENGYRQRMDTLRHHLPPALRNAVWWMGEREDLSPLWAAADIAVCVSRAEAAPRVVLEARRAGLPLVATAVGGVAEQAAHWPASWLVPPADPPALARALTAAWRAGPPPSPPRDESRRFAAMLTAYGDVLDRLGVSP